MLKKEPLASYEYVVLEDETISYFFQTDHQLTYEVSFKPSFYIFDASLPFSESVYELIIKVFDNPLLPKIPADPLIAPTVALILTDFFQQRQERIIVYVCDTSDRKHLARYRKFNRWFESFDNSEYQKIEIHSIDKIQDVVYFNTLIVSANNPYISLIERTFKEVFSEEK